MKKERKKKRKNKEELLKNKKEEECPLKEVIEYEDDEVDLIRDISSKNINKKDEKR